MEDKDDEADFYINVDQMNEENKHSFYMVNKTATKGRRLGTDTKEVSEMVKFENKSDFEHSALIHSKDVDSAKFFSVYDTTNDWVLTKVEYGSIDKPEVIEDPVIIEPKIETAPTVLAAPDSGSDLGIGIGIGVGLTFLISSIFFYFYLKNFKKFREINKDDLPATIELE